MITKNYTSKITITDRTIIIETFVNSTHLVDTVSRGIKENQDMATISISHKQQADVLLELSNETTIQQRKAYDAKRTTLSTQQAALS